LPGHGSLGRRRLAPHAVVLGSVRSPRNVHRLNLATYELGKVLRAALPL